MRSYQVALAFGALAFAVSAFAQMLLVVVEQASTNPTLRAGTPVRLRWPLV